MRSFLNKALLGTIAIAALGLVATPKAHANISLTLVGGANVPLGGGQFRYDYTVTLANGFNIFQGATPTTGIEQGVTLFDFLGLTGTPTFTPTAAGASFAITTPAFGAQTPPFSENGTLNISGRYNGSAISAVGSNVVLGTISAVSTAGVVINGSNPYTTSSVNTGTSGFSQTQSQADGPGIIIIPEANAGLLAGLALPLVGGVAVLRRRKK